ncbi:MAG TPA: OmpH family outer membrane protein [Steroidobacteraceae bacterium]|nr:OmpH family outer membrane protein [Steroidobacteraceae bacterium]
MQFSFRKILLGSLVAATFAVPAMAEIKIGVVDYARLFEDSPQAKVVRENLQAEFAPRLQQLVAQENALKQRSEKLQKDVATMTPEQRSKAEKDLRDAARELERKKGEWQDDSNVKRQEEMTKLQRSLVAEVREYAKSQNFDIVIAEGVIYATPTVDITNAVLAALSARASKPAANPAPAKPPAKP